MSKFPVVLLLLAVCVLAAAAGCTGQQAQQKPAAPNVTIIVPNATIVQQTFPSFPQAPLNQTEQSDIILLQEEEKFIADVNAVLATQHPDIPIFQSIANASKIYTNVDNVILARYNIPNPEKDVPGVFGNQKLQLAYNNAVNTGSLSAKDALIVDATAEDMHIADLEAAIGRTDNRDLAFIYRQELIASRNDLRAISQWITAYGGVYTPTYLTQSYYNNLISTPPEYVPAAK